MRLYRHTLAFGLWAGEDIPARVGEGSGPSIWRADCDSRFFLQAAVRISLSPDGQSLACIRPLGKDKAAVKRLSECKDQAARCLSCFRSRILIANHLLKTAQLWLLVSRSSTQFWLLLQFFLSFLLVLFQPHSYFVEIKYKACYMCPMAGFFYDYRSDRPFGANALRISAKGPGEVFVFG